MKMSKDTVKLLIRMVLLSIYAIAVMKLVSFTLQGETGYQSDILPKPVFAFFYLFLFNLTCEGNLWFDRYLNKKLP